MNEKFKKDEEERHWAIPRAKVWVGLVSNVIHFILYIGINQFPLLLGFFLQPAYNKDEFFDTISCNSLERGSRNGHSRFSRPMKFGSEVFSCSVFLVHFCSDS